MVSQFFIETGKEKNKCSIREKYPIAIIEYTSICCSEVDTQTTSPGTKNKYPVAAVNIIELLDLHVEKLNWSITQSLMHYHITNTFMMEIFAKLLV